LFMNGPLDFTLVFRRYFAAFIGEISRNHLRFDCALGLNPHSPEWDMLFRRLNSVSGDNWIAGDFSNYDGSIPQQFMQVACELVNEMYNDGVECSLLRETMMVDVYSALHLSVDTLYRVFRGNPSGNPFTTVMNSLVNSMLMIYAWTQCGYDLEHFDDAVRMTNFGDDNVLKVDPNFPKFSMCGIADILNRIGVTYTPASKNGVNYEYCSLEDVSFLKRRFVVNPDGPMFAPLEKETLIEMLYWRKDTGDEIETLMSTLRSHVDETFHYGEKYYDEHTVKLQRVLQGKGISLNELGRSWFDTYRKNYLTE
jgi:hypothetical protein